MSFRASSAHPAGTALSAAAVAGLALWFSRGTLDVSGTAEAPRRESWPFAVSKSGAWRQRFHLPLDAGFVAFRAAPDLERAVASLRLRPLRVVDHGCRLHTDPILASVSFGSTAK